MVMDQRTIRELRAGRSIGSQLGRVATGSESLWPRELWGVRASVRLRRGDEERGQVSGASHEMSAEIVPMMS